MNDGTNFHAVIGRVLGTSMQVFFMATGAKNGAPAARTGIAFTGAIGINDDMGECFSVRHSVNLLGLAYSPNSVGFQLLDLIG